MESQLANNHAQLNLDKERLERENTAYSITVANLEKQLEEAKAENERLRMNNVHYEGLLTDGHSLNKIKADAIRDALYQWSQCSDKNLRVNLKYYADKLEKDGNT